MDRRRLPLSFECPKSLASMPIHGSEAERWCSQCERVVHDLSALRDAEARALLRERASEGVCVAYRVDARGQVVFRERAGASARALASFALASFALVGCTGISELEANAPDEPAAEHWADWSVEPSEASCEWEAAEAVTVEAVTAESTTDNAESSQPEPTDSLDAELSGSLRGRVTNIETKAPIEGALVVLQYVDDGSPRYLEVTTDAEGVWKIEGLAPRDYTVQALAGLGQVTKSMRLPPGARMIVNMSINVEGDRWLVGAVVASPAEQRRWERKQAREQRKRERARQR